MPLAAAVVFGLFPLLAPEQFASVTGFPGNDPFIYRLAGAATFGYAVGLAFGLRRGTWAAVKLVVIAVLTFNLASLYACGSEIIRTANIGGAKPVIYLILVTSVFFVAMRATLLYRHRQDAKLPPTIASWVVVLIVIATILAATFGLSPLFFPQVFKLVGYKVTDIFLFGQAGAATFGYAVMGIFELRSRNWPELRSPFVMAALFNGVSFLACLLSIASGEPLFLPVLVAIASLAVTIAIIIALRTNGGTSAAVIASPVARS